MTELFDIEESKSPRLAWMDRHCIKVSPPGKERSQILHHWNLWMAYQHEGDFISASAYGQTEDEAVTLLAVKLKLRLWNEET
jgi:hypothetical protein